MSKILLTLGNITNYIEGNQIIIEKNMILSSGAKDYLAENNIEILYEKKCTQENKDDLKEKIKNILEKEYKIIDEKVVELILKRLNKGE